MAANSVRVHAHQFPEDLRNLKSRKSWGKVTLIKEFYSTIFRSRDDILSSRKGPPSLGRQDFSPLFTLFGPESF